VNKKEARSLNKQARTLFANSVNSLQPKLNSRPVTMETLESRRGPVIANLTNWAGRRDAMGDRKTAIEYRKQIALLEKPLESLPDQELRLCFGLNGIQYVAR